MRSFSNVSGSGPGCLGRHAHWAGITAKSAAYQDCWQVVKNLTLLK